MLTGLGFDGDDREQKLIVAEVITGRAPLTGPEEGRTSKNLSLTEARKLIDTLDGFDDRDALIAFMAEHEDSYARRPAMPSRVSWWPQQPSYLGHAGPDNTTRRPCGCHIDVVVFGHYFGSHDPAVTP